MTVDANTQILTPQEVLFYKSFFAPYRAKSDFSKKVGISRQTLTRVLKTGRGKPATIQAVRHYYNNEPEISGNVKIAI
jgi:predicted DNA-binding protein (UPF0251 family)